MQFLKCPFNDFADLILGKSSFVITPEHRRDHQSMKLFAGPLKTIKPATEGLEKFLETRIRILPEKGLTHGGIEPAIIDQRWKRTCTLKATLVKVESSKLN